jgi:hypothetical protein
MPVETQLKLLNMYINGCKIKITYDPYMDDFADLYQEGDEVFFDSIVWRQIPLSQIFVENVKVYQPVNDWLQIQC